MTMSYASQVWSLLFAPSQWLYDCQSATVKEINWIGAIKCALVQVEVDTCTGDTWSPG